MTRKSAIPSSLKGLESHLAELGFSHTWKLCKDTVIPDVPITPSSDEELENEFFQQLLMNTKRPMCQNIDIIFPAKDQQRSKNQELYYQQFLNLVGTQCTEQLPSFLETIQSKEETPSPVDPDTHSYTIDDEKRMFHINELIQSEENYVNNLRTIVQVIVQPLKAKSTNDRTAVLNQFKCTKIFLNIEQILAANERFLADLKQYEANPTEGLCLGEVCAVHMDNFDCYKKYLLEFNKAQELHSKEFRNNQSYRSFLIKAQDDPRCMRLGLSDFIIQPPQRIPRYAMMIKDILKYTAPDDKDFLPLMRACVKSDEIARMADDDPTKVATLCHSLYLSIKSSPCTLVNQNRTLLACLDATEIDRDTNKPSRPVTIFLFNDKIMIANRPSYSCRGIDLCGITGQSNNSSSGFLIRNIKREQNLKFKGWIDIEQVEIFDGAAERPSSFVIRASTAQQNTPGPAPTALSFERYFHKGPRLYSIVPPKENVDTEESWNQYMDQAGEFISAFQRAQALAKCYDETDTVYHRIWSDLNVYSNMYDVNTYSRAKYKSNIAVVYVEDDSPIDPKTLFRDASVCPWIIAMVKGDPRGFRLTICSKVPLLREDLTSRRLSMDGSKATDDFESVFWNNVILCERHLRRSAEYSSAHDHEGTERQHRRRRSRSRSLPRSSSIPTLGKLLNAARSRSTSPARHLAAAASSNGTSVKPSSSRSSPISGTKKDLLSFTRKPMDKKSTRPRSSSMSSTSIDSGSRKLTVTDTDMDNASSQRRRQVLSCLNLSQPATSLTTDVHSLQHRTSLTCDVLKSSPLDTSWNNVSSQHKASFSSSSPGENADLLDYEVRARLQALSSLHQEHEHFDLLSRPSSRSSSRSSTPSLAFSPFQAHSPQSNFGNTSFSTKSTRSSFSFDEMEFPRCSPPPPPFGIAPETGPHMDEETARKLHDLLAIRKRSITGSSTNRIFPPPRKASESFNSNQYNFIVSSVTDNNRYLAEDKLSRLQEKCQMLSDQIYRLTERLENTPPEEISHEESRALRTKLNMELEEIANTVGHYASRRRSSAFLDANSIAEKKRQLQELVAQRDFHQRCADDLRSRIDQHTRQFPL